MNSVYLQNVIGCQDDDESPFSISLNDSLQNDTPIELTIDLKQWLTLLSKLRNNQELTQDEKFIHITLTD